MQVSETLSCKDTKKGKRSFIKNRESIKSGFVEGARYRFINHGDHIELVLDSNGDRVVSKGNIVDLQNKTMSTVFADVDRVNVDYQKERIVLKAHYSEQQVIKREQSIKAGGSVKIGEVFAGTGNLSLQIKRGLKKSGVRSKHVFAIERCKDKSYILSANDELWDDKDARLFTDDIMLMDVSQLPAVDILVVSYPCVGFSMMQTDKAKRDLRHPEAGVLFVKLLEIISKTNPSTIIIENSPRMRDSDTLYIMDTVLSTTGYRNTEGTLKGHDFGDFEPRERLIKIYTSKGLTPFNVSNIKPQLSSVRKVEEILEPHTVKETDWKPYSYLRNHAKNSAHGHGFFAATPADTKLKTFGANYAKAQPDSSFLQHPENKDLFRMFTPSEHANIRRFDTGMHRAILESSEGKGSFYQRGSKMRAHKMMGDSIAPLPWFAAGLAIGNWIKENHIFKSNRRYTFSQTA